MTTISSTATVIPSYGFNIFAGSTVAGTKKYKIANPIGAGTEVAIIGGSLTGSSAAKAIVTNSSKTFIVTNTTKTYRKAIIAIGTGKGGANLQMIAISTAKFQVLSKTTSVSFSTST
jgi:hypothetical protein